jgi:hypothetical protein
VSVTTLLLSCETVLLALVSLLVIGLLRSHAEILRRLGPEESDRSLPPAPTPDEHRAEAPVARDVAGSTLDGDAIQVGFGAGGAPTLLAFLSSGCSVCAGLWRELDGGRGPGLPGSTRLVAVVKDPSHERPTRLRELAPAEIPLVMSSQAWEDYGVPTSPYFVYIDGLSGRVYGEGAASSWEQVRSLLSDALDDLELMGAPGGEIRVSRSPAAARALRAEQELARAGVGPGHPSLYPSRGSEAEER